MTGIHGFPTPFGPHGAQGAQRPKLEPTRSDKAASDTPAIHVGARPSSNPTARSAGPNFQRLAHVIAGAAGEGTAEGKGAALEVAIGDALRQSFGTQASPRMQAAVMDAFQSSDQLQSLFNRLYSRAIDAA